MGAVESDEEDVKEEAASRRKDELIEGTRDRPVRRGRRRAAEVRGRAVIVVVDDRCSRDERT